MPRISPEARAAAAIRAGAKYPDPPKNISPRAKRIWREVITCKPVDWFDAGNLVLLRAFCVIAADAQELEESMLEIGGRDEAVMESLRKSAAVLTTLGTKLRLTVQANVEWESRKNGERGTGIAPLLGGNAVSFSAERKKRGA